MIVFITAMSYHHHHHRHHYHHHLHCRKLLKIVKTFLPYEKNDLLMMKVNCSSLESHF